MATNARPVGALTRTVVAEIRATLARLERSPAWLAEASGVPLPTLRKILRNERAVDMEQLAQIARAVEITPDEFLAAALRSSQLYRPGAPLPVHGDHPKRPDDNWEIGTPSQESLDILRADAEAHPDSRP